MAVPERKKKPPTFHHLPKSRAKRLKKSWVEDHKIRSKWKAQKKREGLTSKTSAPVGDASNQHDGQTNADAKLDTPPSHPDKSRAPIRDQQSLRDLRKIAYVSKSPRAPKADASHLKRAPAGSLNDRSEKATVGREMRQPNMRLHMNVLLEKIRRGMS